MASGEYTLKKYIYLHHKNVDVMIERHLYKTIESKLFKGQQQEIDYLEETGGTLHAYEIKWNPRAKASFTKTFAEAYPGSDFHVITPENIADFLMSD